MAGHRDCDCDSGDGCFDGSRYYPCPLLWQVTLSSGIERVLKEQVGEVKEVVAV